MPGSPLAAFSLTQDGGLPHAWGAHAHSLYPAAGGGEHAKGVQVAHHPSCNLIYFIGQDILGNLPPASAVASVVLMPSTARGGASLTWSMASPLATPATTTLQGLLPSTSLTGFSLSPASEPFPKKLVDKIRSGQFVEMHELLMDCHPHLFTNTSWSLQEVSSLQTCIAECPDGEYSIACSSAGGRLGHSQASLCCHASGHPE